MSVYPGGHLTLPVIGIQLLGHGVCDCSDKLSIFITKLFYEYFILCKALVLLKAKVTVPYFLASVAKRDVHLFQILDTGMLICASLLAVGLICKLISLENFTLPLDVRNVFYASLLHNSAF